MIGFVEPLLRSPEFQQLPAHLWIIFDINYYHYWILYNIEIFASAFLILISISTDAIIYGFIIKLCCQLEILNYRFKFSCNEVDKYLKRRRRTKLDEIKEKELLAKHIQHHDYLYQLSLFFIYKNFG